MNNEKKRKIIEYKNYSSLMNNHRHNYNKWICKINYYWDNNIIIIV